MRLSIPVNFRFESNADCGGNYLVIFSADDYCVDRVRGGIPQQQNTQPSSICSAMTLLLRHGNCEWRIAKCKFKVCAVCARCRAEFLFLPNIFCAFDAKADTFSGIPYSVFILFNIRHTHARARSKSKNSFHTSDVQSKILLILIHLRTYRINVSISSHLFWLFRFDHEMLIFYAFFCRRRWMLTWHILLYMYLRTVFLLLRCCLFSTADWRWMNVALGARAHMIDFHFQLTTNQQSHDKRILTDCALWTECAFGSIYWIQWKRWCPCVYARALHPFC